jgi:hypothetical protein
VRSSRIIVGIANIYVLDHEITLSIIQLKFHFTYAVRLSATAADALLNLEFQNNPIPLNSSFLILNSAFETNSAFCILHSAFQIPHPSLIVQS